MVRCHTGKTAGFVLAERHLTLPADSGNPVECRPNGKRTFNPGVEGESTRLRRALLRRVKIPHGPPHVFVAIVGRACAERAMPLAFGQPLYASRFASSGSCANEGQQR